MTGITHTTDVSKFLGVQSNFHVTTESNDNAVV